MSIAGIASWLPFVVDGTIVALLGIVLWRSFRDPEPAWKEREERLTAILGDLRLLVAQAEGQARDLDHKLAEHHGAFAAAPRTGAERSVSAERSASAAGVGPRGRRGVEPPAESADRVVERVRKLAAARVPVEEIAQRLSVPLAEVRLLSGLLAERPRDEVARPAPGVAGARAPRVGASPSPAAAR
jgi:hypothetical protein